MNIPDAVLEHMADAMLDPYIRANNGVNPESRKVRIRCISRALAAAEEHGWVMVSATSLMSVQE